MLKKANIQWTAKTLFNQMKKGAICFDNAVQRGYAWDNKRKSLLIHSMLAGYPVPAFYAAKKENGYDMLDGKQRSTAIAEFYSGKLTLNNIPTVDYDSGNEVKTIDINGMTYPDLPEELRDEFDSYSLTIYYFDGITEEEIKEMFFRLNNGKPLTAIELTRVRAKSLEKIREIGKHPIFVEALTGNAIGKYTNEDIIIKAYMVLHEENPSLETKVIRPYMEQVEITDEDTQELTGIFDRIQAVHNAITDKKAAKRIYTKTHFVSIVPIIKRSISDGKTVEQMAAWAEAFFSGKQSATISRKYNENSAARANDRNAVNARLTEISKHYDSFDWNISEE